MAKIGVIGDLHLGRTLYGYDLTDHVRRAMYDFLNMCRSCSVTHAVCLGDVYDNSNPPTSLRKILIQWANEFELSKIKLYLLAGNHDVSSNSLAPSALESLRVSVAFKHVRVIDRPTREKVKADEIHLLPFPSPSLFKSYRQYEELVEELPSGHDHIVAFTHLNIKGAKMGEQEFLYKGSEHTLINARQWQLVVAGHIHKPQVIDGGAVRIQGSAERLSFAERNESKAFLILDTLKESCKLVMRTNQLKLLQLETDTSLWGTNYSPPTTEKIIRDYSKNVSGALVKIVPFIDECSSVNWGKVEDGLLKAGAVRVFMGQAIFVNRKINESKIKKVAQLEPYKAAKHYIFLRIKDEKERGVLKRLFAEVQRDTCA